MTTKRQKDALGKFLQQRPDLDLPKKVFKHYLRIDNWRPARLNQLMFGSVWNRIQLQKSEKEIVAVYAHQLGTPHASGRRRVSLEVGIKGRQKEADVDAYWKIVLDALVTCRLLRGDRSQDVELGSVKHVRGEECYTLIILEDLE